MHTISWNYIIAFYLFAAGLSAGALIVSLIADTVDSRKYERIVKMGAFIAPFPVSLGTFGLVFDLERPFTFWRLFTAFEVTSVMSIGAWILTFFSFASLALFYMHLPDRFDLLRIKAWLLRPRVSKNIKIVAMLLAVGTATYTGVLLCSLVARPFWNTPILPLVFLVSAVIDGIAAINLGIFTVPKDPVEHAELTPVSHFLGRLDTTLMILLVVSLSLLLLGYYQSTEHARLAVSTIVGGPYTVLFWLGVIAHGMLFPLVYGIIELVSHWKTAKPTSHGSLLSLLVASSVLIGGFLLRYVVVYAGQVTGPLLQ